MTSTIRKLFEYRNSCMFLYGMTQRGFDRRLGRSIANRKTRDLIAILRAI